MNVAFRYGGNMNFNAQAFTIFAEPFLQEALLLSAKKRLVSPFVLSSELNWDIQKAENTMTELQKMGFLMPSGIHGVAPIYRMTEKGFLAAEDLRRS
jgi:hypothetical protein